MIKFVLILIAVTSASIFGQDICRNTIYIIYSNGMNNSHKNARDAKNKLEIRVNNTGSLKGARIVYGYAYNYDGLLPLELLEAYEQKQIEKVSLFWKWFLDWSDSPDWFKNME